MTRAKNVNNDNDKKTITAGELVQNQSCKETINNRPVLVLPGEGTPDGRIKRGYDGGEATAPATVAVAVVGAPTEG